MDLIKPIKALMQRGKKRMEEKNTELEMIAEAQKLRTEFGNAKNEKTQWNDKFDREEQVYMGDREFGNIYSDSTKDDIRTTVRISQTFIESQIDLSIPDAVFKPVAQDDEAPVKKLQAEVDYALRSSNLDEINALAEREVKKYGMVAYKVIEDNNYKGYGYRGKPKIICIHPKNILWAVGTTDKNKCRCWYHVENETLAECKKRYGDAAKQLPNHGERADVEYDRVGTFYEGNVNKTNDVNISPDVYKHSADSPEAKYVIIEKWYLDDEEECGLVVFSNECILLKIPKFYHRRKYNPDEDEYEKDEEDNEIYDDTEVIKDDYTEEVETEVETEKGKEKRKEKRVRLESGTEVERFHPKGPESLPIVIQNNIPRSKSIVGISDIERTYDFEQAMKKMLNKHEERILKGNTKILYNKNVEEEAAQLIDNDDLNIIGVNDVNNFKDFEFKDKGREALEFYSFLTEQLQYQMGINQVWQGQAQGEAKSGKAINALIGQTQEKIGIKVNEKNIAFKRLYRLMCNFILCFSDGNLPYRLDNTLQPEYGVFNRYDMVKKDDSGNPIYIDFDIEVSAEQGFPKTKTGLMEIILELAGGGYMEAVPRNILVWQTLAKLGFPNSEAILQTLQNELDNQMMQQQALQQQNIQEQGVEQSGNIDEIVNQLPEDMREEFLAMKPKEQQALINGGQNV